MPTRISRRTVMKAAGVVALTPFIRATEASPLRIGFIGVGARGTVLLKEVLSQGALVPAVCDIDSVAMNRACDIIKNAYNTSVERFSKGPHDYERLLERDDLDAVLIATPQDLHGAMTLDTLKANKFCGCEVPAACTIEECNQLLAARRAPNAGYMMLENYVYPRFVMQVQHMADRGLFGELTYGAGNYLHEIRAMRFKPDGSLTWRGENVRDNVGVIYPTHAVGPVARWMKIGQDDRFISLVAMASKAAGTREYAKDKFGPDSAPAKVDFKNGDTNHALIRTAKGRLIEIRYDTSSPRPNGMGQYSLQGTRGAFESVIGQRKVYLEGKSPAEKWEDLEKYRDDFEHPRWKSPLAEKAKSTGHDGGDYFVIADFLEAIRTRKSPIDMLEAVTWSCIRPLSAESILNDSKPVSIPDFASL